MRQVATLIALSLGLALSAPVSASPPSAPGALTATSASSTQINLAWTASSDNLQISSYVIQRCQGSGCSTYAQVGSVASGTAYTDSGLTPGTLYQYEVYATDSTGAGPNSNVASASTFPSSVTGSVSYTYDALGRLVQAAVPALGIVENYTYDASGNLLSMTSAPIATLEVSGLSSPEGAPGGTVTIVGSGFSTTPSSNTVTINGVQMTVVSATSTELVVDIPAGATSGPIEVQVGTSSVTSPGTLTVTAATGAPTITSFLNAIAATGATVTVTGTGFQATLADNQVQVNQTAATVVAATPTSLTFVVPSFDGNAQNSSTFKAMSAPITVTTPFGSATSATDLVISTLQVATPPPIATVGGTAVTLNTPAVSVYQVMGFSAAAGQPIELVASSISTPSGDNAGVIAPNGLMVASQTFTAAGQSLQIPTPVTGRYSVDVLSEGAGGSVSWSVLGPVTGTLTLNGSPTTETLSAPGQTAQLTFSGTQGANVTLSFTAVTVASASVVLQSPDGATVLTQTLTTAGLVVSPTLPASGTYTLTITPTATSSGAFTAALTSAATTTLTMNGGAQSLTLTGTTPATLTFDASAGQILSLAASEPSGTGSTLTLRVLQPDGTTLASQSVSQCQGCQTTEYYNAGPLTQSGTYSLVASQSGTATNTFALTLSTPAVGTAVLNTPANVSVTLMGQGASVGFQGVAGEYLSATLTGSALCGPGTLAFLGPDGTTIASGVTAIIGGCSEQGVLSAGPLPTSGTYTFLIEQGSGQIAGSGSLTVTLLPLVTGTVTVGSTNSVTVATGQGFEETFAASAGQTLSVTAQASGTGCVTNGVAEILDPNGVPLAATTFNGHNGLPTTCGSAVFNIGPLAQTGNYTVLMQQATSSAGWGSGTVGITPAVIASGSVTVGSSSNVTVTTGQGLSETVSGTAGEYLSVQISSPTGGTAPTSGTIEILSPSGVILATAPYSYAGSGCGGGSCDGAGNINVGPLPSTGQYTIVFEQTNGIASPPGSGSMTVTAEAAAQGTLTLGTPATVTLTAAQAAQESFTGSAGQYATVSLSETASQIQSVNLVVLGPSGNQVATGTFNPTCSSTCAGTLSLNIGPLASAGTYTVLLEQAAQAYGFGTGSVTLTVSNNAPGAGSSQNLSTTTAGATKQFTFTAAADQSFELAFSNMVLTPSSVTSYTIQVLNPSAVVVTNGSCTSGSTCLVPVTNVATSGTYTVTVTPGGSATMSFTASVGPLVTGALTLGSPFSLNLSYPGESGSLTFTATAGPELALKVSGLTSTPASTAYAVWVYDPTMTLVAAASPTSAATLNVPVATTGTYTVSVTTSVINTPATASMQLTLLSGATTSVTSTGAGVSLSTSLAGENAYYTFSGTIGQLMTFALGSVSETPTGSSPSLNIIAPIAGTTWSSGCTTSCVLHLGELPATGTYTANIYPNSATATLSATAYLTQDVTGALTVGTPVNLTLSETGQSATMTFAVPGEAPQTLALSVANLTATPSGTTYNLNVASFNQKDASIASGTVTSGTTLNLPSLAPGTYVITLTPSVPATTTVQMTLEPQNGGVIPTTTSGSGGTFSTPAPGENSYFTFTATAGQNLTLAFSNISFNPTTTSDFGVTVAGPGGYSATLYCYSTGTSSCDMPLRNLPQTGIYTVTVTPNGAATMTYAVTLSVDVTATLTVGTAATVPLAAMGQNAWLTFTATPGETLALYVSGIATTPANTSYTITVYNSSGTSVSSGSATSGITYNLPSLAAGTYNVLITSASAATGTMQVTLEPQTGGTLSITSSGSGASYSTPAPYQNAYFTFSGTTGQNLTLALSGISFVPSSVTYPTVTITGPSSYSVNGTCYNTPGSCEIPLKTLPANGTYSVVVAPTGNATMAFTATLSAQYTGTLTPGTALTVPLTAMGQNASLGFSATAGQTFALYVSGITSTPASTSYTVTVYNSAGTSVGTASSTSGMTLNLLNLAAGSYSVLITPATPATASMQVTLESQVGGALGFSGSTGSYSTSAPGQYGYFTFSGTAGQDLGLALTGLTLTGSSQTYVLVYVYEPNGTMLTYGYCYTTSPGGGCQLSLTNLPITGTYTIEVEPGAQQTMSFNLTSSQDVSGTLALNTPLNVTLVSGQNTWLTFTATAGQTVALYASSIVTNPSGQNVTLTVYNSSGTSMGSTAGTSTATLNLFSLAAGTYSVLAVPAYGASATMQVTLASQAGGALTFNGTTTNYSTTVPGQDGYFTFSGTAGQNLGLGLTGLTLTPSSPTYVYLYVYTPSGSQLNYATCYTTNPGCQLSLINLPTTGTYTIKVIPGASQTMSFSLTPSQDVTGTLTLNTPQNVTLVSGQNTWLTFTASAGQTVAVSATSIVTNPSGQNVTLTVYNSSGTSVGSVAGTGTATLNLFSLTAGTYSVLAAPAYGASATMQITVAAQAGGALTFNGSTGNYSTTVPGQDGYFTFSGTAGQDLALALTALTLTPSSPNYAYLYVYTPSGSQLTYATCYTTNVGCDLTLSNLPTTGTYTVKVVPGTSQTMSFSVTPSQDFAATLALNTAQSVTLGSTGQAAWLTFSISSTQTVPVVTSSLTSTPANTSYTVTVYNSSGTSVGSTSTTAGNTLNLTNLPAGTYNILIYPQYPATASLQVTYQ